jgi:hypothetical protein
VQGQPISQARIKDELHAGIAVHPIPGLVSELHVIAAAKKARYRYYHEWQDLSWQKQAALVAHYFAEKLMEQHVNEAISSEMERRQRRARSKSRKK